MLNHNAQCPFRSVLVVDDDEFSFENLRINLQRFEVSTITWANNGQAAMSALDASAGHPDLVICDIFMPEMDGIEFIGELCKRKYQGGLILITGLDKQMLKVAQAIAVAKGLKLLGTFTKPIARQILEDALVG